MSRKILSLQKAALNPGFELLNKEISAFFHFAVIISTKIISWKSGQTEALVVINVGEYKVRHSHGVKAVASVLYEMRK